MNERKPLTGLEDRSGVAPPPIVRVSDLHYAYPSPIANASAEWILRGVDLAIARGEFVALMGPTGVGKTTLCLALNGIVPQSTGGRIRGDVWVEGLNTKRTPVPQLAQRVGMVFQEPETQLFNMTVEVEIAFGLENLGLPPVQIQERVEWALSLVGLNDFRDRSPFHLSGGQKQRVAIASIMAMRPKILVLDEPTANLDPAGKREVFAVVRRLRQEHGITIVMVEHESEPIAEFADRVVVLDEGQVVLDGPPTEVFAQVERMHSIGLAVPQVSELGYRLNQQFGTGYAFTRLDEAYETLTRSLEVGTR